MDQRIRIANTSLYSSMLPPGDKAMRRILVTTEEGEQVGIIEYLGIPLRSGKGTRYGWRPLFSGYTASQLLSKRDAVRRLQK